MVTDRNKIIAGNPLIAVFDGAEVEPAGTVMNDTRYDRYLVPGSPYWESAIALKYPRSWDYLMPIGKKILDFLQSIPRPNRNAVCKGDELELYISCAMREYNFEMAYDAIVEFIKWYNNYMETHKTEL